MKQILFQFFILFAISSQVAWSAETPALIDQSGGSTPKALALYGIKEGAWSNEDEMFAIIHHSEHFRSVEDLVGP